MRIPHGTLCTSQTILLAAAHKAASSSGAAVPQKGQSQATRREAVAALGAAAVAALGGTDEADIAGGGSVQEDLIDAVADKRFEFLEGVREHRQLLRVQLRDSFANWATRVSATAR